MPFPPRQDIIDFLEKAIEYKEDDCLIWPFGTNPSGHAVLNRLEKINGSRYVSRYICEKVYGPAPTKFHEAAHSNGNEACLSAACINPKHLRWATHQENIFDIIKHGTGIIGKLNGNYKHGLYARTEPIGPDLFT
jgi:hypothetical protein